MLEELLEMNVDLDGIYDLRDIYLLQFKFLCSLFDHMLADYDYLNCKLELDNE